MDLCCCVCTCCCLLTFDSRDPASLDPRYPLTPKYLLVSLPTPLKPFCFLYTRSYLWSGAARERKRERGEKREEKEEEGAEQWSFFHFGSAQMLLAPLSSLSFSPGSDRWNSYSHLCIPFTLAYMHSALPSCYLLLLFFRRDSLHKEKEKYTCTCFSSLLHPDIHLTHKIHTLATMQTLSREKRRGVPKASKRKRKREGEKCVVIDQADV